MTDNAPNPTLADVDTSADAPGVDLPAQGSYEEALQRGYIGTVPPETTATQPLTATGEPAVVEGQPATVDVPVNAQHPLTPHPQLQEGGQSATETPDDTSGGSTDTTTTDDGLA